MEVVIKQLQALEEHQQIKQVTISWPRFEVEMRKGSLFEIYSFKQWGELQDLLDSISALSCASIVLEIGVAWPEWIPASGRKGYMERLRRVLDHPRCIVHCSSL